MVDILHKVGITAPASEVYAALTTIDGLAGWWTTDTVGTSDAVGGTVTFTFSRGTVDVAVRILEADAAVVWEVVSGPEEWLGTTVSFELRQQGDWTIVLFSHEGWKEPVEFMHHCSTKWATFMLSLKQLVETGKGAPSPNDVEISTDTLDHLLSSGF